MATSRGTMHELSNNCIVNPGITATLTSCTSGPCLDVRRRLRIQSSARESLTYVTKRI